MERNKTYYYDISRRFLSVVGQWPYQKPKTRLFFLTFVFIFLINALVTQIAEIFVCKNIDCIFEVLPFHFLMFNIGVKVLTYRFKSKKIKLLTDHLFADWDSLETREEREILKKYAERGRRYALIYSLYLYLSSIIFILTALGPRVLDVLFPLNASRPVTLVYPAYYFVDEEKYFYYIFCNMMMIMLICLAGLIAHDSMFFTYIEHVCGLFAVIGFRFERIIYKRDITKKSLIDCPNNVYHKQIVFSIHAHRQALQFAKLIENVFSISFAIQLIVDTITISITLVQLSMQLHNLTEATRCMLYIFAQLFHLFCFSFQGQKLINHSLETRDKIYNGAWYELPVKEQKLLLIVMRKSIEASSVTACKIYIFSLQNFTTVLQSAMSYFMMLASFSA
ncbi:Odorant receptor 219 [Nylanderia fulva]|uniref:Odorant receptor n=1 Tax=Nylanderia fulva TaxID=613905 RepID=A0A6G1LQ91_9HYME|nr:odorant receptor 67d-like [Nylanderia fulva]KAF3054445.1 Odorant receptor 219 [Nylanderia fulva]